jgi:hypothetical protein
MVGHGLDPSMVQRERFASDLFRCHQFFLE